MKILGFAGLLGLALAAPVSAAVTVVGITGTVEGTSTSLTDASYLQVQNEGTYSLFHATAQVGALKAYTETVLPQVAGTGFAFRNSSATTTVFWGDYFTPVAAPGVTSGSFTAHLLVGGAMFTNTSNTFSGPGGGGTGGGEYAQTSGEVKVTLSATMTDVLSVSAQESVYGGGAKLGPFDNLFQKFDFVIPFTSLDPIGIITSLSCNSFGITIYYGQTATSKCALDHSVYWGGISNPVDQNGAPIAGFQLNGAGGFNYKNASPLAPSAAPEPASWALLIIGFGLTGAMQRRRRVIAA